MSHRSFSPPTSLALAVVTILLSCFLAIGCGNKPDNDPDSGVTNPCTNVTCTKPGEVCQNGQCVNPNKGGACDGVTCEGDAQCSEGKCLCGTTECENGKICQSGSCVDKPTACDNVTCEGDAVCSNGTCLCNGNACSDNQVCRGNVCLDKCGSTECPSGEGCYKDKNKCVSKCDTTCGGVGEKCVNNLCIDLCEGVTCNNGTETCIDGTCVPKVADTCTDWANATEVSLTEDNFLKSLILNFSSESELDATTTSPLTECNHGVLERNRPKEVLTGTYKRTVLKFTLSNPARVQIDIQFFDNPATNEGLFAKLFKGCDASKTVEACTFSSEQYLPEMPNTNQGLTAGTYYLVIESTRPTEKTSVSISGVKLEYNTASSTCEPNRMSCDAGKLVTCRPPNSSADPMIERKRACFMDQCTEQTSYNATCRGEYCWAPLEVDGATPGVHNFKGDYTQYPFLNIFYGTHASCFPTGIGSSPLNMFYRVYNLKKGQEVIFNSRVNPGADTGNYNILFKSTCDLTTECVYSEQDTTSNSNEHKYVATKDDDSILIIVYRTQPTPPSGSHEIEHQIDVKAAP